MKLEQFWQFYAILQHYNYDEMQLVNSLKLKNLQRQMQGQCQVPCTNCREAVRSDSIRNSPEQLFKKCDFYKLVVFGDEMVRLAAEKENRKFSAHCLEQYFYGSQFGGKEALDKLTNREDPNAPIYYYMLLFGFHNNLSDRQGREKELRDSRERLYSSLKQYFIGTKPKLSPSLYRDIKPTAAFDILKSIRKTAVWAIFGIILILVILNAAWFIYTGDISNNLTQVENLLKSQGN